MRVITGTARGRVLEAPQGADVVRPTTDKVKEALFSIINFNIPGATVLDLFAGSGQLGIEALSRGAEKGFFVDIDPTSVKLVTSNLTKCNLLDKAKVTRADFAPYLMGSTDVFDIVFIDPPYHLNIFDKAISAVKNKVSENGIIVCEHPIDSCLQDLDGFNRKDYKYGKIAVTVFRK